MDASAERLVAVFADNRQNVIPIFQRPYVWDAESNWEPMWRDVRRAAEEVESEWSAEQVPDKPPTYFLGAVVTQERQRRPRRVSTSNVIDGQQRLTTLQVLFAAARAVAHKYGVESVEGSLDVLVRNSPKVVNKAFPDDQYKVWPLPLDREAFLWAVRAPAQEGGPAPDHRLRHAREWFEDQIAEWVGDASDAEERLSALLFALEERLQVVLILLDEGD